MEIQLNFAMIFMMGILYGVVWGGLYKAVGIATEAEKKKENNNQELLYKYILLQQ